MELCVQGKLRMDIRQSNVFGWRDRLVVDPNTRVMFMRHLAYCTTTGGYQYKRKGKANFVIIQLHITVIISLHNENPC